jgi:hypothetical protein
MPMMSRILRLLWLLPVVILSGCTTEPNPGGPSVPPAGSVPNPAPTSAAPLKPGSIAEFRKAKLEKEQAEAKAAASKAAAETPNTAPATPKTAPPSAQ